MTPTQKRILVVTPYFAPYGGGLERYAEEVARRHAISGQDVTVLTTGTTAGPTTTEQKNGLTIIRLPYQILLSNTPWSFGWLMRIPALLRELRPDIIHIHSPVPGIGNVVAAFAEKHTPIIVTYHTASMKKGSGVVDVLIAAYETVVLPHLFKRADHIVATSHHVARLFLGMYQHKLSVIEPAVDDAMFSHDAAVSKTSHSLLFVGGLGKAEQHKGLSYLLKAFAQLVRIIPDATLTIVGTGDMRTDYEARAQALHIESRVVFRGRLEGAALTNAYRTASVLVLPATSESEAFGMVLLEAMACGTPVVASGVGGIPALVDNEVNGLLVPPKDVPALLQSLERILSDPALQEQCLHAGLETVRTYSWDARARTYQELFATVATMKKRPLIVEISAYYPPHVGGMERVAQMSAESLAPDFRVRVLTSNQGMQGARVHATGVDMRALPSFEFAHTPVAPTFLLELLTLPKHAVMHLHVSQAFYPELVLLVSKLRGIPYIAHFHLDVEPSGTLRFPFLWYKKLVWGPVLRNAAGVITVSQDQVALVSSKFGVPPEKILHIPNAIDDVFFVQRAPATNGPRMQLTYVGRLAHQKRIERIIEAISLLSIPADLTIVGEGDEREMLERLVVEKELTTVTFVGRKSPEEIREIHHASDALLISSDEEGASLVMLEAMAGGLPIIGTDVFGIHELLSGVGVLVSQPYEQGLATAIEELWAHPERRTELAQSAHTRARPYSKKQYQERLISFFMHVSF